MQTNKPNSITQVLAATRPGVATAQPYSTTQLETSTCSTNGYDAKATVYFYKRLETIYGAMYRSLFKTNEQLLESQKEWSGQIGKLTRKDIDHGMETLKTKIGRDPEYKWPNVGNVLALCSTKRLHPSHRLFETGAALTEGTQAELIKRRNETAGPAISSIKEMLRLRPKRKVENRRLTPEQHAAKTAEQNKLLADAQARFNNVNSKGKA